MGGTQTQYFISVAVQPMHQISRSEYTLLAQISNFEYLMELNTLAGRSYNDVTQAFFTT